MSQISEDCARTFCVRCEDVGLLCNYVIFGKSEKKVMDKTIIHMFEYHAINPGEMTSEMKSRIKENIGASRVTVRIQPVLPRAS
jgi:predicted small metal-binding protein